MKKLVVLCALVAFVAVSVAPVYAAADNSTIELAKIDDKPKKDAKAEEKADNNTDNKADAKCESKSEGQSEAGCESKPAGCEAAAKKDCSTPAKKECGDEKK
jgi:Ni/Co efflux regulator RcnB